MINVTILSTIMLCIKIYIICYSFQFKLKQYNEYE